MCISSSLFDCYDDNAHGASFLSPDKKHKVIMFMIGFVDDTSSQVKDFITHPQPPINTLIQKMSTDAQLWNNLLWTSGEALELPKCSYHIIQ